MARVVKAPSRGVGPVYEVRDGGRLVKRYRGATAYANATAHKNRVNAAPVVTSKRAGAKRRT